VGAITEFAIAFLRSTLTSLNVDFFNELIEILKEYVYLPILFLQNHSKSPLHIFITLTTMAEKNEETNADLTSPEEFQKNKNEASSTTLIVSERFADETLNFVEEHDASFGPLTKEREDRLKWKLYAWVVGMVLVIDLMLFVSGFFFNLSDRG